MMTMATRTMCAALSILLVSCQSNSSSSPACPTEHPPADASAADLDCTYEGAASPDRDLACNYRDGVVCGCVRLDAESRRWFCVTPKGCPLDQPRAGFGCGGLPYFGSGQHCQYGPVSCACHADGQNSSSWRCTSQEPDAGP